MPLTTSCVACVKLEHAHYFSREPGFRSCVAALRKILTGIIISLPILALRCVRCVRKAGNRALVCDSQPDLHARLLFQPQYQVRLMKGNVYTYTLVT